MLATHNHATEKDAEAVPLDLLHSEQERLSAETAQAERQIEVAEASLSDVDGTLGKALDLLADYERAYLKAPGHLRRQVEPGVV